MAVKVGNSARRRSGGPGARLLPGDELRVDGVLPPGLDGGFLQSVAHPALCLPPGGHRAATGPHTLAGVRVEGGRARWFRSVTRSLPHRPLGPVPAIAPSVWLTDPEQPSPDGAPRSPRPGPYARRATRCGTPWRVIPASGTPSTSSWTRAAR